MYSLYVLRLVLYVFQIALKKRGDISIPSAVKNNVVIDRSVSMGTSASETEHMEGGVHSGARYYLLYIPKYHGGKRIFRKNKNAPWNGTASIMGEESRRQASGLTPNPGDRRRAGINYWRFTSVVSPGRAIGRPHTNTHKRR